MDVSSVIQLERSGHVVTVLNEEKELIFGEGVREIGPLTVIEARKGEKTGNIILKSPLALRTTAASESASSENGNIIVVGEYEGKIEMCGKGMTIEAKENSIHGNSGFWAEFNVSALLSPANPSATTSCPLRARSLRPSSSAGGENCRITDLRVSNIPKAASMSESKPFNLIAAKLSECKSNEVLQDSQSGFGVFIPPSPSTTQPSNAADLLKVLFTSDAIKWEVEVMEGQKELAYVSFSGSPPPPSEPSTPPKIEPYRIWVGGRASPMSSECSNAESTICKFSSTSTPASQPETLLTIHKKGVWYALILVSPLDMSVAIHQMFFIPDHSHALGAASHTLFSTDSPSKMAKVVSLVSQKQSEMFTSSLLSEPIFLSPSSTKDSHLSGNAFPAVKPSVTFGVTKEGSETHTSIKLPLSHPFLLNDATILHASSFITVPRKVVLSKRDEEASSFKSTLDALKTIKSTSNGMKSIQSNLNELKSMQSNLNELKSMQLTSDETQVADSTLSPSFTSSGLIITVTMPFKSNSKASFSMVVELVVISPTSFPSPSERIIRLAFNTSLLTTIQDKVPSADGLPTVWIKNTMVCVSPVQSTLRREHHQHAYDRYNSATGYASRETTANREEISDASSSPSAPPSRSLFAVSLFSSPSKSAYTTFVMTRSVSYEGEVRGNGNSNPPISPPIRPPSSNPPPPTNPPSSSHPPPITPPSSNPTIQTTPSPTSSPPSSSTPAPHDTLYEAKPMSNMTKWAIIVISFLLISALGYLAYRYYQSRQIAAAMRQSVALSSREVTQEDA